MNDEWMTAGLCAQSLPDYWHSPKTEDRLAAVTICKRCPVLEQCTTERIQLVAAGAELWGVWAAHDFGWSRQPIPFDIGQEATP